MTDVRQTMLEAVMRNAFELSQLLKDEGDIYAAMHAQVWAAYALAVHDILHGEAGEDDPGLRERLWAEVLEASEFLDLTGPTLWSLDNVRIH